MPTFLIPLHEFNACHTPSGPGGGQFCSKSGWDLHEAHVIRPGQPFDLEAAAHAGDQTGGADRMTRRFLFNPKTREFALGVAKGVVGRDQNHAEALVKAEGTPRAQNTAEVVAQARRYDAFQVHGHIQNYSRPGGPLKLAIVADRVIPPTDMGAPGYDAAAREAEAIDLLFKLAARLTSLGATKSTPILARELGRDWTTLGKVFPELFRVRRKAA
jgi:hypothetical protein